MDSYAGGGVVHRRVPPFGHPRITAHVRLPADFRSLSRPSSAPSAGASAPRSSSVDLEFDSDFSLFRLSGHPHAFMLPPLTSVRFEIRLSSSILLDVKRYLGFF